LLQGDIDSALRLASRGARIDLALPSDAVKASPAYAALAASVSQAPYGVSKAMRTSEAKIAVTFAAFSPDGSRIVTASGDYADDGARIWDPATGKEIAVLRGEGVKSAALRRSHLGRRHRQGDGGPARP
jgi:WD40 repeat protein